MIKATAISDMQNAFAPTPLDDKQKIDEFYVDTSLARTGKDYSNAAEEILMELEDSSSVFVHKLFIGHMGSGKTTELRRLEIMLREHGFFVVFGQCDNELDVQDAGYIDILFLILSELLTLAKNSGYEIQKKKLERIQKYWKTICTIEDNELKEVGLELESGVGVEVKLKSIVDLFAKVRGILKTSSESKVMMRRTIEPRSSELMAQIVDVIQEISDGLEQKGLPHRTPVVLLDGLDKMPLNIANQVFRENGMKFAALPLHLIVSFPIAMCYSPEYSDIQVWFPDPCKLPMIKLRKWTRPVYEPYPEGKEAIKSIVERRANLCLFEESVLNLLIEKTGGCIRDLFRCIRRAAVRARVKQQDTISLECAHFALDELKSDINGRYSREDVAELQTIYDGDKQRLSEPKIIRLLQTGAVMEYNASRWCDIHPLVEEWMLDNGMLTRH